ncbi:hypothetical protein EST38_g10538 [Candolleomyces aberdarensis]|uniref:RRM domain-containing protein n=1 Tax=Candolleomyces aberdarensis TaxID=2316362 RepID=A0A4Q2DAF3_9AGAR|nr:hypothetical protein EST38_g10538 [Candolleomyces aberdarensis]
MVSSKTSPDLPNGFPEFAHTQQTNTVRIENIPARVDRRELVALFRTLIGDVECFRDVKERNQEQLEITFYNRGVAAKALCMNGYSIGGATLSVTAVTLQAPRPKGPLDERRNLYVLGLPFALSKNEFTALFSRYGTVAHSVILATVDNSSRRRGFVVMSSHEEAKAALSALTRTQLKGHTIDVSWAVVQRSQGFLDGGDRTLLLDSRSSHLSGPEHLDRGGLTSSNSDSDYSPVLKDSSGPQSGLNTPTTTTTILITNLPALLFSQIQDLHPLLCPFGKIERVQTVQIPNADTISAVVQYDSPEAALEAKTSLNGQRYDNVQVETHFVHPSFGESPCDIRTPGGLQSNSVDHRISPQTSRAPTPMLGYGGLHRRSGNLLGQATFRDSNGPRSSAYPGYNPREMFSELADERVVHSTYSKYRSGSIGGYAGFSQFGHGMHTCPENAYHKF